MSDGETLLLVLALLYLSDCWLWVTKQSVAFISPWCRQWRVAALTSSLSNGRGGVLFMNPLPPLGCVFLSHLSPISISPNGICAFNLQALPSVGRPTQTGRSLAFSEITGAGSDGAYVLVNNQRFTKTATAKQARLISELINRMAGANPSDRERLVRAHVANQFAADEAAAVLREAQVVIKPIRTLCSILFLFLFVATPVLVTFFGLLSVFIPVVVVTVTLAVQISIMFFRAHKKLYPHESQERIEDVIKMVLCPPVSIRATDILTRYLLSEYSPAVVAALLSGSAAQAFVRAFILDLQHPLKHEVSDEASAEIMAWAASEQLRHCLQHINRLGNSRPEDLLAPHQPVGNSISYCPRCGCQFVVSSGVCPDCPGVGLLAFPQREAETKGAV
jgi:hypothetical protein